MANDMSVFVVFFILNFGFAFSFPSQNGQCRQQRNEMLIFNAQSLDPMITNNGDGEENNSNNNFSSVDIKEVFQVEENHLRFAGIGRLLATDTRQKATTAEPYNVIVQRLENAKVIVAGLGGVGSWAAESLCRSGVGNIVMIDLDDICISNTNRQLHTTSSAIGRMKLDEMKRRLSDINPQCNITLIHNFISVENVFEILDMCSISRNTVLLDAIDGSIEKSALIAACAKKQLPLVTCGSAAGRKDPTKIVYDDFTRVKGDRLLRSCKKNLRKYYDFPRGDSKKRQKKWNIEAIFSTEILEMPCPNSDMSTGSFRQCDGPLGTACFVTGSFGFVASSRVIHMIAMNEYTIPATK